MESSILSLGRLIITLGSTQSSKKCRIALEPQQHHEVEIKTAESHDQESDGGAYGAVIALQGFKTQIAPLLFPCLPALQDLS